MLLSAVALPGRGPSWPVLSLEPAARSCQVIILSVEKFAVPPSAPEGLVERQLKRITDVPRGSQDLCFLCVLRPFSGQDSLTVRGCTAFVQSSEPSHFIRE